MASETLFKIKLVPPTHLDIQLVNYTEFPIYIAPGGGSTNDYDQLDNRPQINGITLTGNKSLSDLNISSENTESGWASMPTYVPKQGEVCLYSDTGRIKIGDGAAAIADLPYIGLQDLNQHVQDTTIHVTAAKKAFWDAKLNYSVSGEVLTFNRN